MTVCLWEGEIWTHGEKATWRWRTGGVHLHPKQHWRLLANPQKQGRGKEAFLTGCEGAWPCWCLDFELLASSTKNKCLFFSTSSLCALMAALRASFSPAPAHVLPEDGGYFLAPQEDLSTFLSSQPPAGARKLNASLSNPRLQLQGPGRMTQRQI